MLHKLTYLISVLLLALIVGTLFASLAAAEAVTNQQFTAQNGFYPLQLHGTTNTDNTTFITEGGSLECHTTLTGTLGERSTTLFLTPTTTDCKAFGFISASVTAEACGYLYHLTTKVSADKYQAHVDITCPSEKSIKIVASTCKAEIKPQTGLTTVDFENMTQATNDLTMIDTIKGVKYIVTQDGFLCPFSGTGTKEGGSFIAHEPITITAVGGVHIG